MDVLNKCHPDRVSGSNPEAPLLETFVKTPCGHKFCKKCLITYLSIKSNCPVCRTEIP